MSNRFVEKLRVHGRLADAESAALERATARSQTYPPRTDLARAGNQLGGVLVMLEGWSFRYQILPMGTRQIITFLMPGDACDLAVGRSGEVDHSIQTQTHAEVALIEREAMDTLMGEYPAIARAMYLAQLMNEGTLRAWIVGLGRRRSVERVAHLLVELYIRDVRGGLADNAEVELPFSQVVLADALGMTPVHINRVLQEFRRAGAVELKRGSLRIQDVSALARISGFDDGYLQRRLRSE